MSDVSSRNVNVVTETDALELAPVSAWDQERPDPAAHFIHARSLVGLDAYCRLRGFSAQPLLRRFGLSELSEEPALGTYLRLDDFGRLLEACARRAGDECFALRWTATMESDLEDARECKGGDDTVCMAAAFAPNLRKALEVLSTFAPVSVDFASFELASDGAIASMQWSLPNSLVCRNQVVDRLACEYARRIAIFTGGMLPLVSVELARETPADQQPYRSYFGVPVRFECDMTRLRISSSALDTPNPRRNDDLFVALGELNRRRLADRRREDSILSRTCEAIALRLSDPDLTLAEIAREMALSSRGLQRRLAEKGTTFQALYEDTRRRVAHDLLEQTDLPMSDIAYRLGFSAVGNFTRAARRWFGQAPSDWRRTRRTEAEEDAAQD